MYIFYLLARFDLQGIFETVKDTDIVKLEQSCVSVRLLITPFYVEATLSGSCNLIVVPDVPFNLIV